VNSILDEAWYRFPEAFCIRRAAAYLKMSHGVYHATGVASNFWIINSQTFCRPTMKLGPALKLVSVGKCPNPLFESFPKKSGGSTSKLLEQILTFFPFGIFLELQQLFGALEGLP